MTIIKSLFIALVLTYSSLYSFQNKIIYKNQINSEYNKDINISLGKKILNWITGKRTLELKKPFSLIKDRAGNLIILDQEQGKIFKFSEKNGLIDLDNNSFVFPSLIDICLGPGDSLFFTDSYNNSVYRIDKNEEISKMKFSLKLNQPTGIFFEPRKKEIWVIQTAEHLISIFDLSGKHIKNIGQRGTANGEFNFPTFIVGDDNGMIYVVDVMNFRVQIFDNSGMFLKKFGQAGDASGYFARPKDIAIDKNGFIYVSDALFHNVQIFNTEGHFLHFFGKQGSANGEFWLPAGLFIDDENNIYVADSYNKRIQIFNLQN